MCSIFQILESCTYAEKDLLFKICKIRNSTISKMTLLLDLFIHKPGLSDSEYSSFIYRDPSSTAYSQLKKRVKEELELLIILLKPSVQNEEIRKRMECTELLLQSQVLLGRGLKSQGAKVLGKCLKKAIERDFADLTLSIFDISQRFNIEEVISKKDLPELEQVIKSHLQILVNQHYTQERKQGTFEKNTHLSQILHQLNFDRKNWGLLATIRQSISEKNFVKASSLIQDSESDFSSSEGQKEVSEEFYFVKLQVLLQTEKYREVIQNCNKLRSEFVLSPENQIKLAQKEWVALFHLQRYEEALAILKKQLVPLSPEHSGKWKYWESVILFRQNYLKRALLLAHECQSDLKNSPNYYLGSKMLELMILFDQNDQDWLEYKMENLRKLICRWKGKISVRIESSFLLFQDLQRHLPFESKADLIQSIHFSMLRTGGDAYAWNPYDYELVRYDQWFCDKINLPVFSSSV